VTRAVHALEEAKLTMEAAKVAVDLARDTLRADERKYELGAEAVFFVLDAQTQLAQAELNLIQAQIIFRLLWRRWITRQETCWSTIRCKSLSGRCERLVRVERAAVFSRLRKKWLAQGDDFRTFLDALVVSSISLESQSTLDRVRAL